MATIYLSSLNGTDGLDVLAEFSGAKVPLPATSVPIVPTANAGTITLSEIQKALKFKTSHLSGSTNAPSSITASADTPTNLTVLSKGVMVANSVGVGSNLGLNTRPNTAFLGQLSKEIFGSEHSADLFNNQLQLATKYVDACDNLNYKIEQNTSGVAATETVNALMLEKSERFALKYNTTVAPAPTASQVNTAVMLRGQNSGVTKEVTVETANNSSIMRITKEKQGAFRQQTASTGTNNSTSNQYVLAEMQDDNNQKRTILSAAALTNSTAITNITVSGGTVATAGTALVAHVVTSNGSGVGLTVKVALGTITSISSITVVDPGVGYNIGDIITIPAVTSGTAGQWASFTYPLVIGDFIAQALVRGKYTLTDGSGGTAAQVTSKRLLGGGWVLSPASGTHLATGVVFEVDVQGLTNSTIESVTVTNAGSGYNINDVIMIAAGALGTGSEVIEFTVTDAMLIGGRFKNNAGLLSAFQSRFIGKPARGFGTGALNNYGTTATDLTAAIATTRTRGTPGTIVTAGQPTLTLKASGSTSDSIHTVAISGTNSGFQHDDIITLVKPTSDTTGAFYELWKNVTATSITFRVDSSTMLTGGALIQGTGGELLAAVKNAVKNGALVTVAANETYSNVALQTLQGSGAIIASITCTGATNSTITLVSLTSGGSNYKVGQLVRIPSGKMGTDSAAITITLTAAMIITATGAIQLGGTALLTALQGSGNGELFVSSTESSSGSSAGTYTAITLNSSHHGKGAEIEVTLNGPNPTDISKVVFTKHGSGYRVGDTVIVPATTLGATSTEIEFKVTPQMLLNSGAIQLATGPLSVPSSDLNTGGVQGTNSGGNPPTLTRSITGYSTDGDGNGATFEMTFNAGTPNVLTGIECTNIGYGFRNGDKITFLAGAGLTGRPSADYVYIVGSSTTVTGGMGTDVTSLFIKGETLTSAIGGGLALGGIGGASNNAVLTMSTINSVQVAMLNEQLDQPTEVPLEAGDTIQSLYKITSKAGQTNSSTHPITIEYDAIFEFLLA